MASGINVSEACITEYNAMKLQHHSHYIIMKLNADNTEIVVDKVVDKAENKEFIEFVDELPEHECRYALLDFKHKAKSDQDKESMLLISWVPDTGKIKEKMLYASTLNTLKNKLVGFRAFIQASDKSDLDISQVREKADKGK